MSSESARNRVFDRKRDSRPYVLSVSLAFLLCAGWGALYQAPQAAKAQGSAPSDTVPNPMPKDVLDLMNSFDDIGELKVLAPLKIKAAQVDAIIAAITETQTDYNRKNAAIVAPVIRNNAEVIKKAKRDALVGKPAPGEEDVIKAMQVIAPKRQALEESSLKSASEKFTQILTKDQVAIASKVAKDELSKLTRQSAPKGAEAQWFNLYVLRVFLNYPRILPLMREMKAALELEAGSGSN